MEVIERKVFRSILDPKKSSENEIRKSTNKEIKEEIGGKTAIRFIKTHRINWLRHIWRVEESAVSKAITEHRPNERRKPI